MEYIKNFFRGALIGVAEVIPGVSGGTIAVLLGIYDKLIGAISGLRKAFVKNLLFLVPLVLGVGAAVLGFSHVIKYLLTNYPMPVNFLFLGLIIGIVPMLLRRGTQGGFKPVTLIPFFVMFGIMVVLAVVSAQSGASSQIITELTPAVALRFGAVGFLAAMCLILPGISGSMIMVIFGIYDSIINAVTELNVLFLLPAAVGIVLGVLLGAKLVDICLKRFPNATYFAILGLVAGSMISLYERAGFVLISVQGAIAIAALIVGVALSLYFTRDTKI